MAGEMTRYQQATKAFAQYAHLDSPHLPADELSAIQVKLARWRQINFGVNATNQNNLGISEELGEAVEEVILLLATSAAVGRMAATILKHEQGIRGLTDRAAARAKLADAVIDLLVFTTQLCTENRIDFGTLYRSVTGYVLERNWTANKVNGGE